MFIGFIAVIIILLVVVTLISSGTLTSENSSQYLTEGKKIQALMHHLKNESKFYFSKNETFTDIGIDYFAQHNFAQNLILNDELNASSWSGWPTGDDNFPDVTYNGPSIKLGGTAGKHMRIVVTSMENGKNAGFFILKENNISLPAAYIKTIESVLASDSSYLGG